MESEILSDEELVMITGYQARAWQRRWLISHGWHYIESRGRRPLVSRQYARQQLGSPSAESPSPPPAVAKQTWIPDFSKVS